MVWHLQRTQRTALSVEAFRTSLARMIGMLNRSEEARALYPQKLAADAQNELEGAYTRATRDRLAAIAAAWAAGESPERVANPRATPRATATSGRPRPVTVSACCAHRAAARCAFLPGRGCDADADLSRCCSRRPPHCGRLPPAPDATPPMPAPSDLSRPALAGQALTGHMPSGDLAAFARDAVPPALHARLQAGWSAGRTRWPLAELPFAERLPAILSALAAPDAETALMAGFERSSPARSARARAAATMACRRQYVERQGDFSEPSATYAAGGGRSRWAAQAPLADRERATAAIPVLVAAARAAGPTTGEGMAAAGMDATLTRLGAFSLEARAALSAGYGLDLDATFDSVDASLHVQEGDQAQVRLRYVVAGSEVDTLLPMERIDGRWYLSDYLRHAREAVGGAASALGHNDADADPALPL